MRTIMYTFHGIGEKAHSLAEKANTAHINLQEFEDNLRRNNGDPVEDISVLLSEVYGELEEIRQELANMAEELGTPSPHSNLK